MKRRPNRDKPIIHSRDHEHGGADPVRIVWEDLGGSGGGGGGGIQFETKPQEGAWLYIGTTTRDPATSHTGIEINAVENIDLISTRNVQTFARDIIQSADRDVTITADRDITMRANASGVLGGYIYLPFLPTSDPVSTGALWNNGGVLTVS